MVQRKNDSKEEFNDYLERKHQEILSNTIRFRWYVVERTPGYHQHSEYDEGDWISAKDCGVSNTFDTEEEAQRWMDQHLPEKGKSLHVKRERLVRRTYTEWVTY